MNKNKESKVKEENWSPDIIERSLPFYTDEDRMAFKIDRKAEDKAVVDFQNNNNERVFDEIYKLRIPTLKVWARRYYYLLGSEDDMFGEFSFYFAKAVFKYDKSRGAFNTCLYTFLTNCVRNLMSGKKAKKRKPLNSDPSCMNTFILSLDYGYNSKDGNGSSLKDILSDTLSDGTNVTDDIDLEETIGILSKQDPVVRSFLRKLSNGDTLASVIKESKTRRGKINISNNQTKKLDNKLNHKTIVKDLIKEDISSDFSLLDYYVETSQNSLHYTIEMKKTRESDIFMKALRKMRKEKCSLIEKIEGEEKVDI